MSADNTGGVAVWIWVLVGAVVGVVGGWWYGSFTAYVLLSTLLGWFVGLSLAHIEGSGDH